MRTKYLIEVNYKTGIQKRFWVYEFNIDGGRYTWQHVDDSNRPLQLGVDDIESIWQVGYKRWGFI